ncbi:MAG: aminotransferase class V-fold PLP-dependent enzyme [Gemmatimonadales bacterium]|nr:MAG: aminotransferase class V-fold PLP-dependent enzyme [Gemmatimonadales bacterium]
MPPNHPAPRVVPLHLDPEEFRRLGHDLVDRIAEFLQNVPDGRVTPGEPPSTVRTPHGERPLPRTGTPADKLLETSSELLFEHSLFNGHPRFWGYITSPPAPIGILADFLASAVNPNVGAYILSPVATEIERQTVQWIAELIGFPTTCGGLLVSGGNMANFVGFLTARAAKGGAVIKASGLHGQPPLRAYASAAVHTWTQKASDLFGLGAENVRYIPVDQYQRIDLDALRQRILADRAACDLPFLVVGTAGSVGTGSIDPLPQLAEICREFDLWFHVDGAYGGLAACLPDAPTDLKGLSEADSVAIDPHKWLYAPLEAGCVLVRDSAKLYETFSYHPDYYRMDDVGGESPFNYVEYGPQNSRGFRALKVWLALQHAGRDGYERMIGDDIALARELHRMVEAHPRLETGTQSLSITTFRYVPDDLRPSLPAAEEYLNRLNEAILTRMQEGGEAFVSNAIVDGRYLLRACIVNFNTSEQDLTALIDLTDRLGGEVHAVQDGRPN